MTKAIALTAAGIAAAVTISAAPAQATVRGCDFASIPQSPVCTTQTRIVLSLGVLEIGEVRHRSVVMHVTPSGTTATFTAWRRWHVTSVAVDRG